jgi:steroid delta-isomerase-like uncharacterized protein
MAEHTDDAERVARAYVEMWNEGDDSRIPELVSESFVHVDPDGEEFHGPDGLAAFMRAVANGFSGFEVQLRRMIAEGDVVMYEADVTMTHDGEFQGMPPTGETVEFTEMATVRVADGTVTEHRVYYDKRGVRDQLVSAAA